MKLLLYSFDRPIMGPWSAKFEAIAPLTDEELAALIEASQKYDGVIEVEIKPRKKP